MVYKQQCQCKNKEFTSGKIQQKKKKKNMYLVLSQLYICTDIHTLSIPMCNKNITKIAQDYRKY